MSDTFETPVPDPNSGDRRPIADDNGCAASKTPPESTTDDLPVGERRSRRRALISAPVRVRSIDVTGGGPDEVSTTLDVSRGGVLFAATSSDFQVAMTVAVTFPYSKSPVAVQAEQLGRVARVAPMPDGRYSVAVTLRPGTGDVVDSGGRKIVGASTGAAPASGSQPEIGSKKPLILVVDRDGAIRDSLKSYLTIEGYAVIALASASEAHQVLNMFTPALLIAEIEGEELPGYELCAFVKGTPRLQAVPVMLLTSSAYPSDYANAHSLGAVVCMAKPYRQERLGHVVRLLAPIRRPKDQAAPVRPGGAKATGYTPHVRFRPPW